MRYLEFVRAFIVNHKIVSLLLLVGTTSILGMVFYSIFLISANNDATTENVAVETSKFDVPVSEKVSIIAPGNETDELSGKVTFTVEIDGLSDISRVEYYIDNNLVATSDQSPYSVEIDTKAFSEGRHSIEARAYYNSGEVVKSEVVYFYIKSSNKASSETTGFFGGISSIVGSVINAAASIVATPVSSNNSTSTPDTDTPQDDPQTVDFPNGDNRPHMVSASVMAYHDEDDNSQQITLRSLPAPGSYLGDDDCAQYVTMANPEDETDIWRWIQIEKDNCVIDGYNFNGVAVGGVMANNATISRNWFHNIDGQDSMAIWTHNHGSFSGLNVTDNLVEGTGTDTGPQLFKHDGYISGIKVLRNHISKGSGFIHLARTEGAGTEPYTNVIADNYAEVQTDPMDLELHLEQINVSEGTGGLLINHNHLIGPTGQTATIYICHDFGDIGNITIDDNLLAGYPQVTIYGGDTGHAEGGVLINTPNNIKITNNKLDNRNGQNPATYGLFIAPDPRTDSRATATGNVWYPSMEAIDGF